MQTPKIVSGDEELETIRTYDEYAASWAGDHNIPDDYSGILAKLKELMPHGAVIDIGCGSGQGADLLAPIGYDYLGTDASVGMITLAGGRHPGLTFQQVNLYDLAGLNRQFDVFWCNAVLLHIPKQRINEALRAISSVVKPGGIGFVSMKDGDKETFEKRSKSGRQENRIFAHWRKDDFENVLQQSGFESVYYEYVPRSERSKWHRFIVRKA